MTRPSPREMPADQTPEAIAEQIARFKAKGGEVKEISIGVQKSGTAPQAFTINGSKAQVKNG